MHTFLRAIGFSEYKSKIQLNDLIAEAVLKADEKLYTSLTILFLQNIIYSAEIISELVSEGNMMKKISFWQTIRFPFSGEARSVLMQIIL